MQINDQALAQHLQKNIKGIYALTGTDIYLLNEAALKIKTAWRQRADTDEQVIDILHSSDWQKLLDEAYSYSLFSEQILLDIRFDKKTIDAKGKDVLQSYLKDFNPRCLIILRLDSIPVKQLQWLYSHEQVVLVPVTPLTDGALQRWITTQLNGLRYDPDIPVLIQQYTQNNMLACAQVITKLTLIYDDQTQISAEDLSPQLTDECHYELYELADACLTANADKAIHLLRLARAKRIEPTLILWLFTQEIRQLIQLTYLLKQAISFTTACSQLKIWPKRAKSYETSLRRLPFTKLQELLKHSKMLDDQIKTNQHYPIWDGFEKLALAICLGDGYLQIGSYRPESSKST